MSNIEPTPSWADVPLLETDQRALAGPGGPLNSQAEALAARTLLLRGDLESANSSIGALSSASATLGVQVEANSTDIQQLDTQVANLVAGQQGGALYFATKAEMDAVTGAPNQGAFVTGGSGAGQYAWNGSSWAFLRADSLSQKADTTTVDALTLRVDANSQSVQNASGYIGRFYSDVPGAQFLADVDVRTAANWRVRGGGDQTVTVVNADPLAFPVAGLFGATFSMQSNTISQRVEILSPEFTPINLASAGFVAGDSLTYACFVRNLSVDPFNNPAAYAQFGFLMGVNAATLAFTQRIAMGNGWTCFFATRVLSAADLTVTATTGSINGVRIRSAADSPLVFSGTLAAPLLFKGSAVGFLRYLQTDATTFTNSILALSVDNQLRGTPVAFVGDSRTVQGLVGTGVRYLSNRSYPFWLRCLSGQAFDTDASLNFGQSGWRTDQILAALPSYISVMLQKRVSVASVLCSTNDRGATNPATGVMYTAQESIDNVTAIVRALNTAGIRVVLLNETPRTDLSGALLAQHVAVRNGLTALNAPFAGVTVAYSWQALADSENPDVAASWATVDGIHMTVRGCYEMGLSAWSVLRPAFTPRSVLPKDNFQVFSRNGNMLANGLMTAGSGAVAASWSYTNSAGGTAVALSTTVKVGDDTWQRAELSGTPSGTPGAALFHRWTQNIDLYRSQFVDGDVLDSTLEVRVESPVGVKSVDFMIVGPNTFDGAADIGGSDAGYRLGPASWSGVLRTLPLQLTGTPANLQMRIRVVGDTDVPMSGVVYWRAASIRRRNR